MRYVLTLILLYALGTTAAPATSRNAHPHQKPKTIVDTHTTAFGNPGIAKNVTRVIDLDLRDTMRIVPDRLSLKLGETVRLRIKNSGVLPHELVLGTKAEIIEHRDMMRAMPTMQDPEANAVSVSPGGTAEIIWRFGKPGSFLYACLIPGHWEAGMQGIVTVSAAPKP